jgi:hypothetical protein
MGINKGLFYQEEEQQWSPSKGKSKTGDENSERINWGEKTSFWLNFLLAYM